MTSNAREICAWCQTITKPGTLPATDGICEPCREKFLAEAEARANPHTEAREEEADREEPEEPLPPRTSGEFAERQRPDGGW